MMYRVLAVIGSALALAACSSSSDWMNLDVLKPGPSLDTVSLESEPPGAEAKASNGQTCRTPCALALPVDAASSVTFTLNGYQPETERLDAITATGEPPRLRPNPVVVELTPAGPSVAKKPAPKKPAAKKPAARPKPAAAASAPMTAGPAQAPSPWPTSSGPTSKLDGPTLGVRAADHARVGRYGQYRPEFLYEVRRTKVFVVQGPTDGVG
jgi:hypothetical protein